MSTIRTKRNHVAALEPVPTDVAVLTWIGTVRVLQPIHQYDHAVSAAAAHADHMRAHIDVVPISADELLALYGVTPQSLAESLSAEERDQLRKECVNACTDAIRYSDDPEVAAEAATVLAKLGVSTKDWVSQ